MYQPGRVNWTTVGLSLFLLVIVITSDLEAQSQPIVTLDQNPIRLDCEVASWVPTYNKRQYDVALSVLCSRRDNSIEIIRLNQNLQQVGLVRLIDETPKSEVDISQFRPLKSSYFYDPSTHRELYYIVAYNTIWQSTKNNNTLSGVPDYDILRNRRLPSSLVKIYKIEKHYKQQSFVIKPTQTIIFASSLIADFDLNFGKKHCYMSLVHQQTSDNVELYGWTKVQFDHLITKSSYALPASIRLFRIINYFYIAIAQQQLLTTRLFRHENSSYYLLGADRNNNNADDDRLIVDSGNTKFIGNAIFRFRQNQELLIAYHQFIKLSGEARKVDYFSDSPEAWSYVGRQHHQLPTIYGQNSFLVFATSEGIAIYIWSPMNKQFWPKQFVGGGDGPFRSVTDLSSALLPNTTTTLLTALTTANQLHFLAPSEAAGGVQKSFRPILSSDIIDRYRPVTSVDTVTSRRLNRLYVVVHIEHGILIHKLNQVTSPPPAPLPIPPSLPAYTGNNNSFAAINPEQCFRDLEGLLLTRERQLEQIHSKRDKIWRKDSRDIVSITAPVIVHGNVFVKGGLIKSPQMVLITGNSSYQQQHQPSVVSPAVFDANLNGARANLDTIFKKLTHAVHPEANQIITGKTRFLKGLVARHVIFTSGIENDDVKLNGIPFKQLEREAITLNGTQNIRTHTQFRGSVVADKLHIIGKINGHHYLRDAVDITSKELQVIDSSLDFRSADIGSVQLSALNSTLNGIRLDEFVTLDKPAIITGVKTFNSLSVQNVRFLNHNVVINGHNVSRLANNAIPLHNNDNNQHYYNKSSLSNNDDHTTIIMRGRLNFVGPVRVRELLIDTLINGHINLTSLIRDSVKTSTSSPFGEQIITGHKRFVNGLHVGQLNTFGHINDVYIRDLFTLRPYNQPAPSSSTTTNITGVFRFMGPVTIRSNLNTRLVNGIDLQKEAVLRNRPNIIQRVTGRKSFKKPLRIVDKIEVLRDNRTLINGFNFHEALDNLDRKMKVSPPIYIDRLTINGNLNVVSNYINNFSCPLQALQDKLVSKSGNDQIIRVPVRVHKLKARSVLVGPRGLNGVSFPGDFVLKTIPAAAINLNAPIDETIRRQLRNNVQIIYGSKTFNSLQVAHGQARLGQAARINSITYSVLRDYLTGEQQTNASATIDGGRYINTMIVHGNVFANRINNRLWPHDILLRSGQNQRIYSHLIFEPSTSLQVSGQLTIRGPINLRGRLNNFNLTQFVQNAVTYGDKDLLMAHRPLRNKIFVGGIKTNELLCHGCTIDGVNFDEMRKRVVLLDNQQHDNEQQIFATKIFTNVVNFTRPITVDYMNQLNLDQHLKRVVLRDGTSLGASDDYQTANGLVVRGHKTILGTIKINKDLLVDGQINGLDLSNLQARSISLSSRVNNTFNRTFIVEGDAFMDQMFIDEHRGIIDGVPLRNLIPIASPLSMPSRQASSFRNNSNPLAAATYHDQQTTHIKSPVVLYTDVIVSKDILLDGLPGSCNLTQALDNAVQWSRYLSSWSNDSSWSPNDPSANDPAARQVTNNNYIKLPQNVSNMHHMINNLALNSNGRSFHLPGRRPGYYRGRRQESTDDYYTEQASDDSGSSESDSGIDADSSARAAEEDEYDYDVVAPPANQLTSYDATQTTQPTTTVQIKRNLQPTPPIESYGGVGGDVLQGMVADQDDKNFLYNLMLYYDRLYSYVMQITHDGAQQNNSAHVNILIDSGRYQEPKQLLQQNIHAFVERLNLNKQLALEQIKRLISAPLHIVGFQDNMHHSARDEHELYLLYSSHHRGRPSLAPTLLDKWHNLTAYHPNSIVLDSIEFRTNISDNTIVASAQRDSVTHNTLSSSYTRVYSWNTHSPSPSLVQLAVLPTQNPTNARFIRLGLSLLLVVGQDPPVSSQCPMYSPGSNMLQRQGYRDQMIDYYHPTTSPIADMTASLQIYLLPALMPGSVNTTFKLFQTIDLPPISYLEDFQFDKRTYLVAVSKQMQLVYLLKLRGYQGFQIVQEIPVQYADSVRVVPSEDARARYVRLAIISRQPGYSKIMTAILKPSIIM